MHSFQELHEFGDFTFHFWDAGLQLCVLSYHTIKQGLKLTVPLLYFSAKPINFSRFREHELWNLRHFPIFAKCFFFFCLFFFSNEGILWSPQSNTPNQWYKAILEINDIALWKPQEKLFNDQDNLPQSKQLTPSSELKIMHQFQESMLYTRSVETSQIPRLPRFMSVSKVSLKPCLILDTSTLPYLHIERFHLFTYERTLYPTTGKIKK